MIWDHLGLSQPGCRLHSVTVDNKSFYKTSGWSRVDPVPLIRADDTFHPRWDVASTLLPQWATHIWWLSITSPRECGSFPWLVSARTRIKQHNEVMLKCSAIILFVHRLQRSLKVSGVPRNEGRDAHSGFSAMSLLKGIWKMHKVTRQFIKNLKYIFHIWTNL